MSYSSIRLLIVAQPWNRSAFLLQGIAAIKTPKYQSNAFSSDTDNPLELTKPPKKIDKSRVPKLDEKDIEEKFISGWGPGGQCVNKSVNCCQLKHIPTGLTVKVHQERSLEKNRRIAREILTGKLDNLINGEMSVENQKKKQILYNRAVRDAQRQRTTTLKQEYKRKQNTDGD